MRHTHCLPQRLSLLLLLLAAACGSSPNRRLAEPTVASQSARASDAQSSKPSAEPTPPGADAGEPAREQSAPEAESGPRSMAEAGSVPAEASADQEPAAVIAFVAGQPILASELLRRWRYREPRKVKTYVQEFVTDRLVLLEARRLDARIDRSLVEQSVARTIEMMERQISENGSARDLESFVREVLQLDPADYMRRMRVEQSTDLLAERCVRAWMLESERAEVRFIAVREQSLAEDVLNQLKEGADFQELAGKYSIDPSAKDGGRMPPIVRAPGSRLSRLAFATPVGQVGGPIEEDGTFMLLLVESRPEPIRGAWTEIGPTVEASLAEQPLEEPEYWQWNVAMSERYTVDVGPFYEYLGEEPVPAGAASGERDARE